MSPALVLGRLGSCPGEAVCAPVGVPLALDLPRTPGDLDQQVLKEFAAANEQVGHGRSGDAGFGHWSPRLWAREARSSLSFRPMLAAIKQS
jgi:hypothetical protein